MTGYASWSPPLWILGPSCWLAISTVTLKMGPVSTSSWNLGWFWSWEGITEYRVITLAWLVYQSNQCDECVLSLDKGYNHHKWCYPPKVIYSQVDQSKMTCLISNHYKNIYHAFLQGMNYIISVWKRLFSTDLWEFSTNWAPLFQWKWSLSDKDLLKDQKEKWRLWQFYRQTFV